LDNWENTLFVISLLVIFGIIFIPAFGTFHGPELLVQDLVLEEYVTGLCCGPTTMTFVGDDILILQKNGLVRLVHDRVLQEKPVLEIVGKLVCWE